MRRRRRGATGRGSRSRHAPEVEFLGEVSSSTSAEAAQTRLSLSETRRREMIRQAEQLAKEIKEQHDLEEKMKRANEAKKRAKAAEERIAGGSKGPSPIEQFAGATEELVATLPRIQKVATPVVEEQKQVAAVRPHSGRDLPPTLPIERRTSQAPLEWDDDNLALQPEEELQAPRPRSRSSSRRRRAVTPVIAGPPGVPSYELAGSLDSAPGEGKHRKKNKPYNPRRHLQMDDYESFCLDEPVRAKPEEAKPKEVRRVPEVAVITRDDAKPGPSRITWAQIAGAIRDRGQGQRPVDTTVLRGRDNPRPYGKMYPPGDNVPYDEYDPPPTDCWNCWSSYHKCSNCPKPKSVFCKNCGRRDTLVERCPRCGPGYSEYLDRNRSRRHERTVKKRAESAVRERQPLSCQVQAVEASGGWRRPGAEQFRPSEYYNPPSASRDCSRDSHRSRSASRGRREVDVRAPTPGRESRRREPYPALRTQPPAARARDDRLPEASRTPSAVRVDAARPSTSREVATVSSTTSSVDEAKAESLMATLRSISHFPPEVQWQLLQNIGYGAPSTAAPSRRHREDEGQGSSSEYD